MRIRFLAASLLAASALAGTAAAQEEPHNWTSFYVGVNLGGSFVTGCPTYKPVTIDPAAVFTGERCPHPDSFIGGGQVGFNYQTGNLVLGIEGDVGGATGGASSYTITSAGTPSTPPGSLKITGDHTPSSIETVRARVGFAYENWLVYITGGGAFAGGSTDVTGEFTPAGGSSPTAVFTVNNHGTRVGWTIGGGLEYYIGHHWSVKLEDVYVDVGTLSNSPTVCSGAGCTTFVDSLSLVNDTSSLNLNVIRLGVNYSF